MSRNGKVIVAMSGGVDSSVAACLLKEQGYECVGVFMRVGTPHDAPAAEGASCSVASGASAPASRRLRHGCCSASDAQDARVVAGKLGAAFYALNYEREFERIIDYFVDEYGRARTPNPCVMCNIHLKFGRLLQFADMMDAPLVATGHYARVLTSQDAGSRLRVPVAAEQRFLARAVNLDKDQSYVLFGIRREELPRCVFPLGAMTDKALVRQMAASLGLRVHDKPDSQEICFVPDNDYRGLIRRRRPELLAAGELRHEDGRMLGRHEGIAAYTIGQRRGLGVALGEPAYVTRLNVVSNTVTLGTKDDLLATGLEATQPNWLIDPAGFDAIRSSGAKLQVKIRHMHAPAPATVQRQEHESLSIRFDQPQSAVTPGQAAVVYCNDVVLAGAWIREAISD